MELSIYCYTGLVLEIGCKFGYFIATSIVTVYNTTFYLSLGNSLQIGTMCPRDMIRQKYSGADRVKKSDCNFSSQQTQIMVKWYNHKDWALKERLQSMKNSERFGMIFHMYFTCFFIKISWRQIIHVIETMLSVQCHFFCKSNCFLWVIWSNSYFYPLKFQSSAMRLFISMNLFSPELYMCNLNIRRIWLIKALSFSKKKSLSTEWTESATQRCS